MGYEGIRSFLVTSVALLSVLCCGLTGETLAGNEKTVALVMKALSNPFWVKVDRGVQEYARKYGIRVEMFGVDRETNAELQIKIVDNLISRGYGAIILAPNDSKKLIPICIKALESGIKVITIDNRLDPGILKEKGVTIPFIGADNVHGGQMIGDYMRLKLNGKGKVLIVEGTPGVSNSDNRKNGFIQAVSENNALTVVKVLQGNWHRGEAFEVVAKELAESEEMVDAIFCVNDEMVLGALQALEVLGKTGDVLLAGYDNTDTVRVEMRNHRIHATIEQYPEEMGHYAVNAAWKSLNGEAVDVNQSTPLDLISVEHVGRRLTFSVSSMSNQFFSTMAAYLFKQAEVFGMDVTILDAENKDAKQVIELSVALEGQIDMLIVNPTNSSAVTSVVELAKRNRVPVITVDRRIHGSKVLSHIESDNRIGGSMAAHFMAEQLEDKGNILELEGIPGTSASQSRGLGFNEAVDKYPGVTVVKREVADFDRQRAKTITLRLLREGLKVDGIFAHNDDMVLGCIDAYVAMSKRLPSVLVGFDGIDDALEYIRDGKLTATIAQHPEIMGKMVVQAAAEYFRGGNVIEDIQVDLQLIKQ